MFTRIIPQSFILFVFAALLTNCSISKEDSKEKNEKDVKVGDKVTFSGYVQKAFTITVNDVEFSDSENFYTRFIDELILSNSKYEILKNADINLEGAYGLSEFGKNSKVYMSSVDSDGHLFEATTDSQSKFTIDVTASALDETFKARAILRIGLEIKYPKKTTSEHYCYILYGLKEDIKISENSKPVIFDNFKTQLNTYKCEDIKESELIIPTSNNTDGTEIPADDTTVTTDGNGNTIIEPYVTIASTTRIASILKTNEEGTNLLSAITFDSNKFYLVKGRVKNKDTGKYNIPFITLNNLSNPSVLQTNIDESEANYNRDIKSLLIFSGKAIAISDKLVSFDLNGSNWQDIGEIYQPEYDALFMSGGTPKVSYYDNSICTLNFDTSDILQNCVKAPTSNTCHTNNSMVFFQNAFYGLSRDCEGKIVVYNKNFVQQKAYVVSKLLVSSTDMESAKIVTDGTSVWLVNLSDNELVIRKLEFVEQ